MKFLIVTLGLLSALSAIAAENAFFAGYAKGCEQTKDYVKFKEALCKGVTLKDGSKTCQKGRVLLPSGMSGAISKMERKPEHSYFVVTLDTPVTYAGNTIVAIDQLTGHENGIQIAGLITDSRDLNDAKNRVKASGTVFRKSKSDTSQPNSAEVVKYDNGTIVISCDTSN